MSDGTTLKNVVMVSVLMTAYNREKFIGEAIESVLANGYHDFELIIVDDGSTDNTIAIASAYKLKDSRISVYENEKNLGDYPNRNRAASFATGKYLVHVDSDDTMFPDVLAKWIAEMEEKKASFGMFIKSGHNTPFLSHPEATIRTHFFKQAVLSFGPCATIVRRDYFFQMKAFPVSYGPANDMYQHIKLASSVATLFFPFPLVNYRLHDGQERNNVFGYLFNNYIYLRDALREIRLPLKQEEIHFLDKKNKRRFIINIAKFWLRTRDFRKARQAIVFAEFTAGDFLKGIFHI